MKILLAEDDTNIVMIAKMVLEKVGGHEVTVAPNGEDALNYALAKTFDLIILDGMMPKLSGVEVAQKYSKSDGTLAPIIFMSAKSNQQDLAEFSELGVGYIQKPFEAQTLCQQIDTILGKVA